MEKTIAKIISILFQPLFIPIYGILLLANSPYLFMYNQYGKLFVFGIVTGKQIGRAHV